MSKVADDGVLSVVGAYWNHWVVIILLVNVPTIFLLQDYTMLNPLQVHLIHTLHHVHRANCV